MKNRIATRQAIAAMLCMTLAAFTHKEKLNGHTNLNTILTAHQWTLTQLLQIKNDSINDLTLLLMPCEKDNYLLFNVDGSYQIQEGLTKCNIDDNNVKGKGTWLYLDQDSTIEERYEGGSRIYKKITTISNDLMVLEYVGEGKKKFRLTYVSEQAQQNVIDKNIPATSTDADWNIRQIIRQLLLSTNHFILVDKNTGVGSIQLSEEDKKNPMPKIALLPFANNALPQAGAGNLEADNASALQAASEGFDYVITGKMLQVKSSNTNNNDFLGTVMFDMEILEVTNSIHHTKKFNSEKKEAAPQTPQRRNIFDRVISGVRSINTSWARAWLNYYLLSNVKSYNDLSRLVLINDVANKANDATTLFSNVNEAVRKRYYDSTTAVVTAVNKTRNDLVEFLGEHVVNRIKINRIDGSGRRARMVIEAGHNINLQVGEILNVVKCTSATVAGKTVKEQRVIGQIKVAEITADVLAACSFENEGRDIQEAYAKAPDEITVVTTLQKN